MPCRVVFHAGGSFGTGDDWVSSGGCSRSPSAQVIGSPNDRHAGTSPVTTGFLPVCSDDDGGSLSRPVGVPEAPIGLSDAGDLPSFLPIDQNSLVDAAAAQIDGFSAGVDAGAVQSSSLEATEPTWKNSPFRYERTVSLADVDFSVRPCNLSAVVFAQKSSKPLYFYNRKHKVQRASKLDLGEFAGDLIHVAPGAVPLVGSQCSISGGLSGLFAAFEPVGLAGSKVGDPFRRSPLPATILDAGDSSESDLLDGYSEVVVSSLGVAQALGISFGGHKKIFLDLMSVIEKGQHRVDGGSVSKPKGWRELKNLECSLNFDVGDIGSNRSKNRASLRV
ncbi:hypothetical protein SLA2020_273030 [Shorea laevis]